MEDFVKKSNKPTFPLYKPSKEDSLDVLLASFLNGQEMELIPSEHIQRVGNGVYIFGTTKVQLRCINGKLIGLYCCSVWD
jgi:hypothetical protein